MADSTLVNDNFEYLDNRITTVNSNIYSNNARFESDLATLSASLSADIASVSASVSALKATMQPIGQFIPRSDDTLLENEIRLEGATVSRTTYADLFAVYGTTYGAGDGSTTFKLPDFRNRVPWGATSFGYQAAGLPNIKGTMTNAYRGSVTGAFYYNGQSSDGGDDHTNNHVGFDASRSNSIYGANTTVVPPGVKVRWVTRFE